MPDIKNVLNKYRNKADYLDLELLVAVAIGKTREFVLAHPEYKIPATHNSKLEACIKRRIKHEPLAYILGQKEFYGLNFKVNRHTLIPRPETELLVEEALILLRSMLRNTLAVDIGTGSGNIIISIAKNLQGCRFYGIDISEKALQVAKQNAKKHKVDKKIKFLRGNLLNPLLKANKLTKLKAHKLVIVANLPYLAKNIYASVSSDIKKYEPRSALLSGNNGLAHYERLLKQIKTFKKQYFMLNITCFMEIGPEQKTRLPKLFKSVWPDAQIDFQEDLAGKWRLARINID